MIELIRQLREPHLNFVKAMGMALAACHLLTAYSWFAEGFLAAFSEDSTFAACHGFFLDCLSFVSIENNAANTALAIYALLSLACILLLAAPRYASVAVTLLWLITLFKAFIFLSRFNVMGNYHLIHFVLLFVFLLLPGKKAALSLSLVLLYFSAGFLKLSPEWLSGAALLRSPLFSGQLLLLSLSYVVVLELIVVWGLLSNSRLIRSLTLFQLLIFHIFSWHIVGYFYPTLMILLLLPFFMDLHPAYFTKFKLYDFKPLTVGALTAYVFFNVYPYLVGADAALEGRFRGLRINMLDARPFCHPIAILEEPGSTTSLSLTSLSSLRVRCDSSVFETQLRKYCSAINPGDKIHYILYSRKALDSKFKIIKNQVNYCAQHDS